MCETCKNCNDCPNKLREMMLMEAIATLLEEKKDSVEVEFPCNSYIPKVVTLFN